MTNVTMTIATKQKVDTLVRSSSQYVDCYLPADEMLADWVRIQTVRALTNGATIVRIEYTKE